MDGPELDVSTVVSLKITTISDCHNNSGSSSSCSLFSENVNGEAPASASDTSQHLEMLMVNSDRTTEFHKVNDLGCEGDNISCISKADGTNLEIGGHNDDTEQKNMTGSSASVNGFCQEGSQNPIIQSVKHGSVSSDCVAEKGNKFRVCPEYAREALQSAADISDRSDPSETSSFGDEHSGAASLKIESFSPGGGTSLLTNSQKQSHDCNNHLETDAEIDDNQTVGLSLNKLDEKQHLEMRTTNDASLPCCAIKDNEDSDELVDVSVCDICGDVGRESLLAICSKCSDGAEHIYCMRIKMDKVPKSDWNCEECMRMAESQKQKAEEPKRGRALQKSSANRMAQSTRKSNLCGDNGRVKVGHAFLAFSGKRPADNIEVSPSTKKRVLENDVKVQTPSGSHAKGVLPRHANLKIVAKGKVSSSSGCNSLGNILQRARKPLVGKSSNVESQFCKGSLFKQKCSNVTDLRNKRESEDVNREQITAKGSPTYRVGLRHALAKLRKSKSFIASNIASIDTSDSKKNMHSDFKVPKLGSRHSLTRRSFSFNSKISQPVSPVGGASISRVKPAKVTPAPGELKQQVALTDSYHDTKTAEVHRDLERLTICHVAKRQCIRNGSGRFDKKMCIVADKGRSSGNFGRTSSGLGQRADRKTANMEAAPNSRDTKHELNDTDKAQLTPGGNFLFAVSAHPNVDYVWRGMFNVKECNKLPTRCTGLQAHLSTCASPEAYEVVSKFPCDISVKEVLQGEIWPAQFVENGVNEDNIALYFFAEDFESYRSYKRFLNCLMLNDLALKSNLNGVELLIFPSHILPARSRRWNNIFFLWGVLRAKKLSFPEDVCVPSPCNPIQIPMSDVANSPQHTPSPILSGPRNSNISAVVGGGSPAADTVLGSVQGSGSSSSKDLQSSVSTKSKCMEGSPVNEFDVKTMGSTPMEDDQHSEYLQTTNKVQTEDPEVKTVDKSSPCVSGAEIPAEASVEPGCTKDMQLVTEAKHQAEVDLNYPCNEPSSAPNDPVPIKVLQGYDDMDGGSISLNSGPSSCGGTMTLDRAMDHVALNLELSLWSERKPAIEVDLNMIRNAGDEADGLVSLDLSLALRPTGDKDPDLMEEELLPAKDDVDTSLFLFCGGEKA